ncbi:MAG: hypothetical protein AAFU03_04730, partial [Bacteroidota bacterium]
FLLLFFAAKLAAQDITYLSYTYFHLEAGPAAVKSIESNTVNLPVDHRYAIGGSLFAILGHRYNKHFALETGVGFQFLPLEQRSRLLRFGCDGPAPTPASSYVDASIEYITLSIPLAARIYLSPATTGLYLRPTTIFNFSLGSEATADLYECGAEEERMINAGPIASEPFFLQVGGGIGYEFSGHDARAGYLEIYLSSSLGKIITFQEDPLSLEFLDDASALMLGIKCGWQIGG